jgi:hypothetical protein
LKPASVKELHVITDENS